eukprot:3951456-Pleurochrysis_carterae.AAC.1
MNYTDHKYSTPAAANSIYNNWYGCDRISYAAFRAKALALRIVFSVMRSHISRGDARLPTARMVVLRFLASVSLMPHMAIFQRQPDTRYIILT